eukprot:7751677-Ditylum_brightwellii.AAC.1
MGYTVNWNKEGYALVLPLEMEEKRTLLFLEGPPCMMKAASDEKVCTVYNNVKESKLCNKEFKMYKISQSLKGQSYDMGQVTEFPADRQWSDHPSLYFWHLQILQNKDVAFLLG